MFYGEYLSHVDDRDRGMLPAELRKCLDEECGSAVLYVTLGPDGCIELCPPSEWRRRLLALRQVPFARGRARRFRRTMSAFTERSALDQNGRFRIPHKLLDQAGIDGEVMIIGSFDGIEMWDRNRWRTIREEALREFNNDAEQVFGLQSDT